MGWMSAIVTPTKRRWAWNYHITQWRQEVRKFRDQTRWWQDAVKKASTQQSGPPGLRLTSPGKRERNAVLANRSVCCSSVQSPTPSHTQPFQIKWEVYFSKNCVARLYCVVVMILHAHVDVYVLCVCIDYCDYTAYSNQIVEEISPGLQDPRQAMLGRPKIEYSEAVLLAIEANSARNTWRVSDQSIISHHSQV